jgi:hypothetical protein
VNTQRGFTTERDFSALYAEDARVSARRAERRANWPAWQKAQFHQPVGEITGEIQVNQCRSLAAAKFRESTRLLPPGVLLKLSCIYT